ncbi:protamine-like protein [Microplitis demolitor]|uniref:protamine-like protein n=1 Tax=Microplitis demolitor TaxID=69319 RepID=UPI0004CCE4A1|nr:protamine-like protein [Microplitis demolitor]
MVKQPPKMTKLVVSAIKNLRDVQGSTTKDILNYVMREFNSEPSLERRLRTALKRGIDYGILIKKGPHYLLNTDPEMTTADPGPMERGGRRRKRGGKKGRRGGKKGRRGRGRRRRGGKRKGRGKSRGRRRRRSRRRRGGRGKKMRKRGGVDDMDMLAKEPFEATGPTANRADPDAAVGATTYERPRSRSRSRQSRSRSRTPSHSRSSGSSDREGADGRRQAD